MNDPWKALIDANPSNAEFSPDSRVRAQIEQQPVDSSLERGRRVARWIARGLAVGLAALVLGSAVSWATGTHPLDRFERIWGLDRDAGLSVDESAYGLDQFSVLEPMTDEQIDELPEGLKFWLLMSRSFPSPPPPPGRPVPDDGFKSRMIQKPGRIAALGETTTEAGESVSVVSMNDQVCALWRDYNGGSCGTVEEISRKGLSTIFGESDQNPRFVIGLVTDEVHSLRIDYPGYGEVPVRDNVFRVADIPEDRFFLVGRDEDGSVVTRIFVARPLTPAQKRFSERSLTKAELKRLQSRARAKRLRPEPAE